MIENNTLSPEFSILLSPENGENKSPEFGMKSKARKWEITERIAKYELFE